METSRKTNEINLLKVTPDQKSHHDFLAFDLLRKGLASQKQFPVFHQVAKFYNYFNTNNKKIKTFIYQYDVSIIECTVCEEFKDFFQEIKNLDVPFVLTISFESLNVIKTMLSDEIWQKSSLMITYDKRIYEILSQGVFHNFPHFVYIQPGIETLSFQRDHLQPRDVLPYLKSLSHVSSRRYIAYGNLICTESDVDFLSEALKSLSSHLKYYTFLIPTARSLSDVLRSRLQDLSEHYAICLVDVNQEKEISLYLAISDAVVVFNHQYRLTDLFMMMIAQSLETLVIECTPVNQEPYVNDQKTGLHLQYSPVEHSDHKNNENQSFEVPNFKEVAKKIDVALQTDTSQIVNLAKQYVQENHDMSLFVEQVVHLYRTAIQEYIPPQPQQGSQEKQKEKQKEIPKPKIKPKQLKTQDVSHDSADQKTEIQNEQNILDHTELVCVPDLVNEDREENHENSFEAKSEVDKPGNDESSKDELSESKTPEVELSEDIQNQEAQDEGEKSQFNDPGTVNLDEKSSAHLGFPAEMTDGEQKEEEKKESLEKPLQKSEENSDNQSAESSEVDKAPVHKTDRSDNVFATPDTNSDDFDQKVVLEKSGSDKIKPEKKTFGDQGDVKLSRQDFSKLLLTDFIEEASEGEVIQKPIQDQTKDRTQDRTEDYTENYTEDYTQDHTQDYMRDYTDNSKSQKEDVNLDEPVMTLLDTPHKTKQAQEPILLKEADALDDKDFSDDNDVSKDKTLLKEKDVLSAQAPLDQELMSPERANNSNEEDKTSRKPIILEKTDAVNFETSSLKSPSEENLGNEDVGKGSEGNSGADNSDVDNSSLGNEYSNIFHKTAKQDEVKSSEKSSDADFGHESAAELSSQKKVLVFAHGDLSALIKACGAFKAIRKQFPNDLVHVYTLPKFVSFLKFVGYFDAVLPDEKNRGYWSSFQFVKSLKSAAYDYIIDLQGSDQTKRYGTLLNLLGGVAHKVTDVTAKWIGHVEKSPYYQPEMMLQTLHPYDRYYDLLNRAHFHLSEKLLLQPNLSHIQLGIRQNIPRPYFLLIPGREAAQKTKRWPALFYAEIANMLMHRGIHVVLIGDKADDSAFEVIRRKCPDITDLVGKTELYEVLSLAKESIGVLGNDTEPMFLAHASGQNVIIPWSSFSNDELNAPKGDNVTIIREAFLTNLSPHRVWHEVKKLLPLKDSSQ